MAESQLSARAIDHLAASCAPPTKADTRASVLTAKSDPAIASPVAARTPGLVKLIGMPVICLAMFSVMGGHWAILQVVAWSKMIVAYSQDTRSVTSGIQRTFSGEFPCEMCKSIAEARKKQDKEPAATVTARKIEILAISFPRAVTRPVPRPYAYPATADSRVASRRDPPPTPVPIHA